MVLRAAEYRVHGYRFDRTFYGHVKGRRNHKAGCKTMDEKAINNAFLTKD